jgi:hypothetical protein
MTDLNQSLVETLSKADLPSLLMEYGEIAVDGLMKSPAVEKIPILGSVVAIGKVGLGVKDFLFTKKLVHFLNETKLSDDERTKFSEKVTEMNDAKLGERVIFSIDKCDEEKKVTYVGKLFKQYSQGKLPIDMLKRLLRAVELSYVDDLDLLKLQPVELQNVDASITDNLYSLGLLELPIELADAGGPDDDENPFMVNGKKYKVSLMGVVFSDCVFKEKTIYIQEVGRTFLQRYINAFLPKKSGPHL